MKRLGVLVIFIILVFSSSCVHTTNKRDYTLKQNDYIIVYGNNDKPLMTIHPDHGSNPKIILNGGKEAKENTSYDPLQCTEISKHGQLKKLQCGDGRSICYWDQFSQVLYCY